MISLRKNVFDMLSQTRMFGSEWVEPCSAPMMPNLQLKKKENCSKILKDMSIVEKLNYLIVT